MSTPFELQTGQSVGVTRHVLNQVMALQDGAAALFFCYLLARPEPLDFSQAEFTLGLDEKELKRVFCLLRDSGLLSPVPAPSVLPPADMPAEREPDVPEEAPAAAPAEPEPD
ncbi:MAG: hypothetical protein FWH06_03830, partial [Oscillospiraceae bacterium]|nr:hypothetical protein [Oscillospiraceae bacterium]